MPPRLALLALALVPGCSSLPRDQSGATDRIQKERVLRVGIPAADDPEPGFELLRERERRIVERIAKRLGARVESKKGNVHQLLEELQARRLPLVAAELPSDSPFSAEVGMSRPFVVAGPGGKSYALAVAPGENRLLLLVDQAIAQDEREKERS